MCLVELDLNMSDVFTNTLDLFHISIEPIAFGKAGDGGSNKTKQKKSLGR